MIKRTLQIVIVFFSLIPIFVFASEVRIETNRAYISTGDEFLTSVFLSTNELMNAVEGEIIYDPTVLNIKEIREGNSVINFWVDKPYIKENGKVSFSGITPGGLSGSDNLLLSIVFVSKLTGKTVVFPNTVYGLLHDGEGTKIELNTSKVEILIKEGDSNVYVENLRDEDSPEFFNPIITRENTIFDNQYFISFSTQDKGVGMLGYEIKEYTIPFLKILTPWKPAESPYVLSDQSLESHIEIKAIDQNNNTRIIKILAQSEVEFHKYVIYFLIISLLFLCFILFKKINLKK